MDRIENECLSMIRKKEGEFSQSLQKYKLQLIREKKITEKTDQILSYFLLSLLAEGKVRRYSLNRAEISSVIEAGPGRFPSVDQVDLVWKASLLGDIPQMKQTLNTLPETHLELGRKACSVLQERKEIEENRQNAQRQSKLQEIIRGSNVFFKV